jgi:hypothetical protein
MGFMRDQASRLIRERWGDVNEFAEEMYAIWTADKGVTFDGPVTINNSTGGSSVIINQGSIGDTTITINNNPGPRPSPIPGNTTNITNSYVTNIYGDGTIEQFPTPPPAPAIPTPGSGTNPGGGGGGFPGKVLSGSGTSYQVAVYEAGLSSAPITRTVTQLSILATESIPANTWTLVGKVGTSYFMQVPVWLSDLTS